MNRETWNRLPRTVRGAVLVLLGSGATAAVMTATHSDTPSAHRAANVSFDLGIGCAERPSAVTQTHSGDRFTIECVNPDGTTGTVTQLGQLVVNHSAHPSGYDAVVTVTSPDVTSDDAYVSFDFTKQDGLAVIGTQQIVGQFENNSNLNAIVRVTNNTVPVHN